jgi:DNA (cytosine-5)-methyltransferase 1
MSKIHLNTVGIFCGAGGLDLGLEAAGFDSIYLTDIDSFSIQTLNGAKEFCRSKNIPFLRRAFFKQTDISQLKGAEILSTAGLRKGEIDLLAGGPPCQAFSVFGKRRGRLDPRGTLVYEYARLLTELRPKAFLFENVAGLLTVEGGAVFQELLELLSRPSKGLKYTLSVLDLQAADFGVPQFRRRIFIAGSLEGKTIPSLEGICSDKPALGKLRYRTVADAFKQLPQIGHGSLSNHTGRKHSQRIIDRYRSLEFGERDHCTRINKLDPSRPSFTIIVGSDKGGGKGHVHPLEPREVTPRESARIQTFPDWMQFSGSVRHPIRQIGNAVPPLLAAMLGREIAHHFFETPKVPFREIITKLSADHLFEGKDISRVEALEPVCRQNPSSLRKHDLNEHTL